MVEWYRNEKRKRKIKMQDLYEILSISRQAIHQGLRANREDINACERQLKEAMVIRKTHRRMGCRKIANQVKTKRYGRDKTEQLLLENGLRIHRKRKHIRTTQSQAEMYFPNLIEGLILTNKNQVIQTDITYFRIGENHYYIVFIIDIYTRLITGYNVGQTMKAEENIKALLMAIRTRNGDNLEGMIHHSDKGSQYIDKDYLGLIKENNIVISMCRNAWENAYTERINRTIKEEYLEPMNINNFAALKREVKKAVYLYNHKRPHQRLYKQMTPIEFEHYLTTINQNEHPEMLLYKAVQKL